jgi:hypothetical protein
VDAFIDTFGSGYIKLALDLGVRLDRIDTIIDIGAATEYGLLRVAACGRTCVEAFERY